MKKIYYKIEFQLQSPLIIGCGKSYITDNDVNLNSNGKPYIPGSAIAGVLRHSLSQTAANEIFGETKGEAYSESKIITYDANVEGWYRITIRDGVKLDDNKVAVDGAKLDFQVVETSAKFVTYLEVNDDADVDEKYVPELLAFMKSANCHFGAKTTRGYGSIEVNSIGKKSFDITPQSDEMDAWLDFDLYSYDGWEDCTDQYEEMFNSSYENITIKLQQRGGISIRKYSTDLGNEGEDKNGPDFVQLTTKNSHNEETPVVPGTSWAGAFRSRMKKYWDKDAEYSIDTLFGTTGSNADTKTKSNIYFSETRLENAIEFVNTRTAIDRFSGGSLYQALFKEKTYYYGKGNLVINIKKDNEKTEDAVVTNHALAATLTDLHYGFLAVGGETSIGRGLFEIIEIVMPGKEPLKIKNVQENGVYKAIVNYLGEKGGANNE